MQLKQTADATTSATPNAVTPMSGTQLNVFSAIFFADKNNADDIFIGPTSAASLYPVSPGQWYEIDLPGDAFGPPGAYADFQASGSLNFRGNIRIGP